MTTLGILPDSTVKRQSSPESPDLRLTLPPPDEIEQLETAEDGDQIEGGEETDETDEMESDSSDLGALRYTTFDDSDNGSVDQGESAKELRAIASDTDPNLLDEFDDGEADLSEEIEIIRGKLEEDISSIKRQFAEEPLLTREEEISLATKLGRAAERVKTEVLRHPFILPEVAKIEKLQGDECVQRLNDLFKTRQEEFIRFQQGDIDAVTYYHLLKKNSLAVQGVLDPERFKNHHARTEDLREDAKTRFETLRSFYLNELDGPDGKSWCECLGKSPEQLMDCGSEVGDVESHFSKFRAKLEEPIEQHRFDCALDRMKKRLERWETENLMPIQIESKIWSRVELIEKTVESDRDKFVRANLRLVISNAKKKRAIAEMQGLEFIDLLLEGSKGLLRAVEGYKVKKGFKFSTYATWWINQAMGRLIEDNQRSLVRVPKDSLSSLWKLRRTRNALAKELGRDPSVDELSKRLEWSNDKTKEIMRIPAALTVLDGATNSQKDGSEATLGDFLEDTKSESPHERLEELQLLDPYKKLIPLLLAPREYNMLGTRFGVTFGIDQENDARVKELGDAATLEETGSLFKVTRERVRQIVSKVIHKISDVEVLQSIPRESLELLASQILDKDSRALIFNLLQFQPQTLREMAAELQMEGTSPEKLEERVQREQNLALGKLATFVIIENLSQQRLDSTLTRLGPFSRQVVNFVFTVPAFTSSEIAEIFRTDRDFTHNRTFTEDPRYQAFSNLSITHGSDRLEVRRKQKTYITELAKRALHQVMPELRRNFFIQMRRGPQNTEED